MSILPDVSALNAAAATAASDMNLPSADADLDASAAPAAPAEQTPTEPSSSSAAGPSGGDGDVESHLLPIANIYRIMRNSVPSTSKISKDAKECIQECVSEFILFITSEASDRCAHEKRKTVNGEDILFAMTSLGFENYAEVLKIYLAKYREQMKSEKNREENSDS